VDAAVVVETLLRDGEVAARVRLDRLPAVIGRGYDCDVIVDDPYVAARHARVLRDERGALVVEDLGTANGLIEAATGERQARFDVGAEAILRAGRTLLRIRGADFPVAPERIDRGHRWIERWPYAVAACILVLGVGVYQAWVGAFGPRQAITGYVTTPLVLLAVLLVWAGGWAMASRLFARHAHFVVHLSVAATGLLALLFIGGAGAILAFASGASGVSAAAYVLMLIGLGVVVFVHLALIRPLRLRRMAIVAGAVTALLLGLDMFRNYQSRGILIDVPFMAELSWPRLRVARPDTLDNFMQRAAALKPEVDRLRNDRGDEENEDDD
jgi:hypothetical protein